MYMLIVIMSQEPEPADPLPPENPELRPLWNFIIHMKLVYE